MASGKTTLGKVLANKLGVEFYDLDELIMKESGKTVKQIFAKDGEEGFRTIERQCLLRLLNNDNYVLSTGGGAPCYKDNLDFMLKSGKMVYLDVPAQVLVERLAESKIERPLIWGKSKEELHEYVGKKMEERKPFYEKAHIKIDALDVKLDELIGEINK